MKTHLDIYDLKQNHLDQDEHGENCEKIRFCPNFFLANNGTETL